MNSLSIEREVTFALPVVGVTHRNRDGTSRQHVIRECCEGQQLRLVREPENKHDCWAIAVHNEFQEMLGYLPGGDKYLAEHMDEGGLATARIIEIQRDEDSFGCRVQVTKRLSEEQVRQCEYMRICHQITEKIKLAKSLEKEHLEQAASLYFSCLKMILKVDSKWDKKPGERLARLPVNRLSLVLEKVGRRPDALKVIKWYESYDDHSHLNAADYKSLKARKQRLQNHYEEDLVPITIPEPAKRKATPKPKKREPSSELLAQCDEWQSYCDETDYVLTTFERAGKTVVEILCFEGAYIDSKLRLKIECAGPRKYREDGQTILEWDKNVEVFASKILHRQPIKQELIGCTVEEYESLLASASTQ